MFYIVQVISYSIFFLGSATSVIILSKSSLNFKYFKKIFKISFVYYLIFLLYDFGVRLETLDNNNQVLKGLVETSTLTSLLFVYPLFIATLYLFNKKSIAPKLSEKTFIIWNQFLIYLMLVMFGISSYILWVALIPFLFVLVSGFTDLDKTRIWKKITPAWFLITLIIIYGITFFQFPFYKIINANTLTYEFILLIFSFGINFATILIYLYFFLGTYPPLKSSRDIVGKVNKKNLRLMGTGKIWEKDSLIGNIVTVLIMPLILILNYLFSIITAEAILLSIVFIIVSFVNVDKKKVG